MISERQLLANRRNALKSRGPITPEGRAAVRQNALKHGFTAAEVVLPNIEQEADFEAFRAAFEAQYQPVGPTEQVLLEDMVIARWRLNRFRRMEAGFFAKGLQSTEDLKQRAYPKLDAHGHLVLALSNEALYTDTYGKMSRYEVRFERTFYKALKELLRLQSLREVSDSGNGTVLQNPVSPDPEPQPEPIEPQPVQSEPPIPLPSAIAEPPQPPSPTELPPSESEPCSESGSHDTLTEERSPHYGDNSD